MCSRLGGAFVAAPTRQVKPSKSLKEFNGSDGAGTWSAFTLVVLPPVGPRLLINHSLGLGLIHS